MKHSSILYGDTNHFVRNVGRGCTWKLGHHLGSDQRFVLIFDEDVDLRVLPRIELLFNTVLIQGSSPLIVGERKGALSVLFDKMPSREFCEFLTKALESNPAFYPDEDSWSVYLFSLENIRDSLGHFAHPAMPESVMQYLLERLKEKSAHV